MDDFQHLPTSLTGVVRDVWVPSIVEGAAKGGYKARVRRYVGFGRGYISDLGPRIPLGEYWEWLEAAEERLTGKRQAVGLLDRYARVVSGIPKAPDARNILLDLDEARATYQLLGATGSRTEPLDLDDACADCVGAPAGQPRTFSVAGHDRTFTGTVQFDRAARKYIVDSPELSGAFHSTATDRPGMDLVQFLNRQQAFLVLPDTPDVMYAEGAFFAPEIGTGANFDADRYAVGQVLETHRALESIVSEKGDKASRPATRAGWHADTVFGWFDANINNLFSHPDLVICDDMGTESADFIVLDKNEQRVVLVHCKAKKIAGHYGATALQEVSGQAKKNCGTLNLFNPLRPSNCKRWHEAWQSSWVTGTVTDRVRFGRAGAGPKRPGNGERLWERIEKRIRNPNVEREVWLVLGATLSKASLEAELRKAKPAPEAIQTTYLLQSTLASIGGANARLSVLCGR